MISPLLVGVAGGSGSGKTTLALRLLEHLAPVRGVRIPFDAYYRDLSHLSPPERTRRNFDHPDALDVDLLARHLDRLKAGAAVQVPRYDFASHTRRPEGTPVEGAPVVVIDGVLVLAVEAIRSRLDLRVFVDTRTELRLDRRIRRDATQRGRDLRSVVGQWEATVEPMHRRLVEPSRAYADVVVGGEGALADALDLIAQRIRAGLGPPQS